MVEDISTNVLLSALHAPLVMLRWAASVAAGGTGPVTSWRVRNALVGVPLAVFATDPSAGGYYVVSARRSGVSARVVVIYDGG